MSKRLILIARIMFRFTLVNKCDGQVSSRPFLVFYTDQPQKKTFAQLSQRVNAYRKRPQDDISLIEWFSEENMTWRPDHTLLDVLNATGHATENTLIFQVR